ncbi:hypothetical protein KQI41_05580 [Tissierella pigra]|uniref:Uncharacterized protein n=1 Tax=Tissierella pigra TaxID=2607614 RepID=A0A6N7XNA0_9FIRM|nr:hypothetical protein [Tissierella pigra]MBU5425880.1 hypothetical protein [Tissierella pigra]MSU02282.1 hypothetical protein [Tissierella pigra]
MSKYDDFDLDVKSLGVDNTYKQIDLPCISASASVTCEIFKSIIERCVSDNCSVGPCTSMNSIIVRE